MLLMHSGALAARSTKKFVSRLRMWGSSCERRHSSVQILGKLGWQRHQQAKGRSWRPQALTGLRWLTTQAS